MKRDWLLVYTRDGSKPRIHSTSSTLDRARLCLVRVLTTHVEEGEKTPDAIRSALELEEGGALKSPSGRVWRIFDAEKMLQ
jgi:hypothetical protein